MKRFLPYLALFGVNVVVTGLMAWTFFFFFFRNDPVRALLPGLLALPGLVLQPWFILFFFLPGGPLVAPVLATTTTFPVYRWLHRRGRLQKVQPLLYRLQRARWPLTFCFVFGLAAIGLSRHFDFPALGRGTPPALVHETKNLAWSPAHPRFYCLNNLIDSEWLYQARLSEADWNRLTAQWHLQPLATAGLREEFQSQSPYWWHPAISDRAPVLSTPGFPPARRGADGWYVLASWNPEDQMLHMWIKDNF